MDSSFSAFGSARKPSDPDSSGTGVFATKGFASAKPVTRPVPERAKAEPYPASVAANDENSTARGDAWANWHDNPAIPRSKAWSRKAGERKANSPAARLAPQSTLAASKPDDLRAAKLT